MSKNYKIQFLVNDKTADILNMLNKFDKARFVEIAIQEAFKSISIKNLFNWNEPIKDSNKINEIDSKTTKTESTIPKKKSKIDNRW